MDTIVVAVIIAAVVIALAAIIAWAAGQRRSSRLREGFGLEYEGDASSRQPRQG